MLRSLQRLRGAIYRPLNWLSINIAYLKKRREYLPSNNSRPMVLMMPVELKHPFYLSWRQGIEAAGWEVCWIPRGDGREILDQFLLYLVLCFSAKAVHLIDVNLHRLAGEWTSVDRIVSFVATYVIALWPRLLGRRVVYSFGNVVPHEFDTSAERKRHQIMCSLVQDVTSHSPSITQEIERSGIPTSRIWPAEQPDISEFFKVPVDWPNFREQYGIPEDAIVLLQIGTIRPYKGIETTIEAFKDSTDPRLRLVIAGKPAVTYTAARIAEMTAGDDRIILGPLRLLSDEEMAWMFQAADYCLLPYRDISHSSLVCQSLGLGVPVIGSRAGCLPDYLNKGAGIPFTPGDVKALATIFDDLSSFDRASASAAGIRIMRQRTIDRIGQRLVRLYEYRRGGPTPESDWLF